MTKRTGAASDEASATDTTGTMDAVAPDETPHFDPNHEWPARGGSYVRQADGTLTRED